MRIVKLPNELASAMPALRTLTALERFDAFNLNSIKVTAAVIILR
jgi:hypothetical protein